MKWAGLLIAVSFSLVFGQTTVSAAGQTGNDAPGRSLLGMEQIADNGRHGKFKGPKWKHYQAYAYRDYRAFSWGHGGPPPWAPAHGYRRKHGQGPQSYAAPFGIGTGGCNKQVRAKPFPAQSEEYRALEYFHTYMRNGLAVNGPGARK